jgi:hypothetical protein
MVTSTHAVGTLGYMVDKISDEIARPDLNSQIRDKITEAIAAYQPERFFFSESRDITFNTVAGQEFYGAADNAAIPTLEAFDYIILYIGSIPWPIARRTDVEIEVLNQNGLMRGQPWNWSYYNLQLRLGPVPDAVYSMRIACHQKIAAPANDDVANNPWMTDNAERLIRCRAKYELYLHVIRNMEMAEAMASATTEAFDALKGQTNRLVGRGLMAPMEF